jgi:hypothetical protein
VTEYCDCGTPEIFAAQTCDIPHTFLNHDLRIEACTVLEVRARLINPGCEGQWSLPNTKNEA